MLEPRPHQEGQGGRGLWRAKRPGCSHLGVPEVSSYIVAQLTELECDYLTDHGGDGGPCWGVPATLFMRARRGLRSSLPQVVAGETDLRPAQWVGWWVCMYVCMYVL